VLWGDDGKPQLVAHFKDGRLSGGFESSAGENVTGTFLDDLREGHWVFADADGVTVEGDFKKGLPVGRWSVRDAKGNVHQLTWADGAPSGGTGPQVEWAVVAADTTAGQTVKPGRQKVPAWLRNTLFVGFEHVSYLEGQKTPFHQPRGAPLLWTDFETLWHFDACRELTPWK
jgi:hypothetical protein